LVAIDPRRVSPANITRLLHEWQGGNRDALDQLIPIVYKELRTLASRQLATEWRSDRLQTTALVNEAYVKLFGQHEVDWQNRGHFFAIAAKMMRRILIDYARRQMRRKHGGDGIRVGLEEAASLPVQPSIDTVDILALDRALQKLEELDADQGRIVELRFFGGLTVEETAGILEISEPTVNRDWQTARIFLRHALRSEGPP